MFFSIALAAVAKSGTAHSKLNRADATPAGRDVTSQLSGTFPSLQNDQLSVYTYRDEGPLTYSPRIRLQLMVPEAR